jgi:hypothetical protein
VGKRQRIYCARDTAGIARERHSQLRRFRHHLLEAGADHPPSSACSAHGTSATAYYLHLARAV